MACNENGYWDCSDGQGGGGGGLTPAEKKDLNEVSELSSYPTTSDFTNGVIICKYHGDLYVNNNGTINKVGFNQIKRIGHKPTSSDFKDEDMVIIYLDKLYFKNGSSVVSAGTGTFVSPYSTKSDLDNNAPKEKGNLATVEKDVALNNGLYWYDGSNWILVQEVVNFPQNRVFMAWDKSIPYKTGDYVIHSGKVFIANQDTMAPTTSPDWSELYLGNFYKQFVSKTDMDGHTTHVRKGDWCVVTSDSNPKYNGIWVFSTKWELKLITAQIEQNSLMAYYNNNITYNSGGMCFYLGKIHKAKKKTIGHNPSDDTYWSPVSLASIDLTIKFAGNSDYKKFRDGTTQKVFKVIGRDVITIDVEPINYNRVDKVSLNSNGANIIASYENTIILQIEDMDILSFYGTNEISLTITRKKNLLDLASASRPFGASGTWWLWSNGCLSSSASYAGGFTTFLNNSNNDRDGKITTPQGIFGKGFGILKSDKTTLGTGNGILLRNMSFTLMYWVRQTSIGDNHYHFGNKQTGNSDVTLHVGWRDSDSFTLAFWANDVNWDGLDQNKYYTHWTHYAVQYKSEGSSRGAGRLWINGEFVSQKNFPSGTNFQDYISLVGGFKNQSQINGIFSNIRIGRSSGTGWLMDSGQIKNIYDAERSFLEF